MLWSLHAFFLSLSCSMARPSLHVLSLISSSSVVCSRSATLNLATALLLRWNRASTCSGPYCGSHVASFGSSAPVFAPMHPSRCSDVWRYSGSESAGMSTFMHCCCETSVICCTFWQLQRSLHIVDMIAPDTLHLVNLVLLHIESGES